MACFALWRAGCYNFTISLPREAGGIMADKPTTVSLYQQKDQEALSLESNFPFHCHADLACFNQCCHTPTIVLSPYDLLRLKQGLGLLPPDRSWSATPRRGPKQPPICPCFSSMPTDLRGRLSLPGAARLHGVSQPPGGLPPLPHFHGQPIHAGRHHGSLLLPPVGSLSGIRHRGNGRWPPGWPTRDLPNLTRGAGNGWKSCCKRAEGSGDGSDPGPVGHHGIRPGPISPDDRCPRRSNRPGFG